MKYSSPAQDVFRTETCMITQYYVALYLVCYYLIIIQIYYIIISTTSFEYLPEFNTLYCGMFL